ncbi:MAG TPA: hypothetical protein VFV50_02080 [Bdellovibrionales bacterium]|nr:hypothetical protein [Bdellovibrionales bacterium]
MLCRFNSLVFAALFGAILAVSPAGVAQENCSNYFSREADEWMARVNYELPALRLPKELDVIQICLDTPPKDFNAVLERAGSPFGLPLRCIGQSVKTARRQKGERAKGKIVGTCKSPHGDPVDQRQVPCYTPNLAYYTHFVINSALACMHDPADPLDLREIFALINHESNFVFDISSAAGRGLMQLTTAGVAEFNGVFDKNGKRIEGQRSLKFWNQVAYNTACQIFAPVINENLKTRRTTRTLKTCEYIGSQDAHKRNMIVGLSLYKLYRERAREVINEYVAKLSPARRPGKADIDYMVKQLVRYMYNQGDGAGREAFFRMTAGDRPLDARTFQKDLENAAAHFVGRDVANFPRNVDVDLDVIEEKVGTCFIQ